MLIIDVIRETINEHEIYFLLTSYVEAVRYCDPLHHLPEAVTDLPFVSAEDVSLRIGKLRALQESLEARGDGVRLIVAEALGIFAAAARRLESIRGESPQPLLEAA
jgi:hypothetical protein